MEQGLGVREREFRLRVQQQLGVCVDELRVSPPSADAKHRWREPKGRMAKFGAMACVVCGWSHCESCE